MISAAAAKMNYNAFDFTLQTSSGDRIELSMYDKKEIARGYAENDHGRSAVMSLRHEYGYAFSYEGNGLDKKDMEEIEAAMKKIKPLFERFLQSVKESDEDPDFKTLTNVTQQIRDLLPLPKNDNHAAAVKEKTLDALDGVLRLFERNRQILENVKKLFDKLFEEAKGFDFYA